MTVPKEIIVRKLGELPEKLMNVIDDKIKISIGL